MTPLHADGRIAEATFWRDNAVRFAVLAVALSGIILVIVRASSRRWTAPTRMGWMRHAVREHDIHRWAGLLLGDLATAPTGHHP